MREGTIVLIEPQSDVVSCIFHRLTIDELATGVDRFRSEPSTWSVEIRRDHGPLPSIQTFNVCDEHLHQLRDDLAIGIRAAERLRSPRARRKVGHAI